MTTAPPGSVSPQWLGLREPPDHAARSAELVDELRQHLTTDGPLRVHDLACGSGSMLRWLAPLLPGRQHWTGHDRDPTLLAMLATSPLPRAADGAAVTVHTDECDLTTIDEAALDGTDLITASALLDILTAAELARLVTTCLAAGCPALLALSVTGEVELRPEDPRDERFRQAFNDHQRRTVDGRALLGPDAAHTAEALFRQRGARVLSRPSLWRLGADDTDLIIEWLTGWVGAACEQRPELNATADDYLARRTRAAAGGTLGVVVAHRDLLVVPLAR